MATIPPAPIASLGSNSAWNFAPPIVFRGGDNCDGCSSSEPVARFRWDQFLHLSRRERKRARRLWAHQRWRGEAFRFWLCRECLVHTLFLRETVSVRVPAELLAKLNPAKVATSSSFRHEIRMVSVHAETLPSTTVAVPISQGEDPLE